jgi:hypothetical protein
MLLCRTTKLTDFRKLWLKPPELPLERAGAEVKAGRPVGGDIRPSRAKCYCLKLGISWPLSACLASYRWWRCGDVADLP